MEDEEIEICPRGNQGAAPPPRQKVVTHMIGQTVEESEKKRRGSIPADFTPQEQGKQAATARQAKATGAQKGGTEIETKPPPPQPARRWSVFAKFGGTKSWTDGKLKDGLKLAHFKKRVVYFDRGSQVESLIDGDEAIEMWVMECKSEKSPFGPLPFPCEWREGDYLKGIWDPKLRSLVYLERDGSTSSSRVMPLKRVGNKLYTEDTERCL